MVAIQEEHTYSHVQGQGLLHRGQHMHGAREITEGERYNLIVWMRASSIRNNLCPMCDQPPTLVATEGCGAGFTKNITHEPCTVVWMNSNHDTQCHVHVLYKAEQVAPGLDLVTAISQYYYYYVSRLIRQLIQWGGDCEHC